MVIAGERVADVRRARIRRLAATPARRLPDVRGAARPGRRAAVRRQGGEPARPRVAATSRTRGSRRRSRRWCASSATSRSRSTSSETEALLLEYNLIKEHRPRFNVMLRDDKSFPYIQLTTHDVSAADRSTAVRASSKGRYFGPYPERLAPCARRCSNCRSCSGCATAATRSSPTARGRACSTRSGAARRRASASSRRRRLRAGPRRGRAGAGRPRAATSTSCSSAAWSRRPSALDFERAALLRDQLASLRKMQATQSREHATARDLDAFAAGGRGRRLRDQRAAGARRPAARHDDLFPARAGRRRKRCSRRSCCSTTRARTRRPKCSPISTLPDAAALEEALSEPQRTARSRVARGRARRARARWVEIATENADQALQMRAGAPAGRDRPARRAAATRSGCRAADRGSSASTSATRAARARSPRASCSDRRAARKRIPALQHRRRRSAATTTARCARRSARRYARIAAGEFPMPDVLFIDGGAGQLHAVLPVLDELGFAVAPVVGVSQGRRSPAGQERLHPARAARCR